MRAASVHTPQYRLIDTLLDMTGIFAAFLDLPYPVLLDSPQSGTTPARYSYLAADPFMVVRSKGQRVWIEERGEISDVEGSPFDALRDLLGRYRTAPVVGLPPFQGGAIGYLAYELAHHLELLPGAAEDNLGLPELNVAFYDWVVARDETTGETWTIATGIPDGGKSGARDRLDWIEERVHRPPATASTSERAVTASQVTSNFTKDAYMRAVRTVKDYIAAGDVYQVNISQRFEADITGDPWELYRRLRHVNPSPFSAYLGFPEVSVLSASPEEFLKLEDGLLRTRPMKGTRPRGRSASENQDVAAELLASEKDRAENVMIVDLMRNDLGRVCVPGSIAVPELFAIEEYPTVYQMVSTVTGRTRTGVGPVEVLEACFPGGSVTGAPKIRAMEIIDEIEPVQRSVYCGAIGYIGFDGSMLMSVPIRNILVTGDKAYIQVGGGIVADSDPESEYRESLDKAAGSLMALDAAISELDRQPG
jgi:para-aminobenzoate synthetase component I